MISTLERDNDRQRLITRRTLLLGAAQGGLTVLLLGRLFQLQILKGEAYNLLSEENRISMRVLPPPRGQLKDRTGAPLALNQQVFRAIMIREDVRDVDDTLSKVASIITIEPDERSRILRDVTRSKGFMPVTLKTNLTWDEISKLEVLTPELPGVAIDMGELRNYPLGAAAAHVIGYVATPSVEELKNDKDKALGVAGMQIGKTGAEKLFDADLRGVVGALQLEVNAKGRVVKELRRIAPDVGAAVQLTLDAELQNFLAEKLSTERSAASVIMDAHTGAVYALASSPGFDPNIFAGSLPDDIWQALLADPTKPMINKIISGQYPPGSTFKMVTGLAALHNGLMTPDQTVFCQGFTQLGNHQFHCWKKGGHGTVDLVRGFAQSCDCYFYEMAKRAGIDNIATVARRLGLGHPTNVGLPSERAGHIPDRAWKKRALKADWTLAESFVCGIGQGYVTTTPMQLAVMLARLVNGGKNVSPTLRLGDVTAAATNLGFKPEHLAVIMEGMRAVVQPGGTAAAAQIHEPGMQMGGKTGTAQVQRITQSQRDAGFDVFKLPWEQRHHALFVGYAPVGNPRYVSAVIVEHGGAGASVAAPIARDGLYMAQQRDCANNAKTMAG